MNPILFIALLPIIEIILLIAMGAVFGFWFTLMWILGTAVVGVGLLRTTKGNLRSMGRQRQFDSTNQADSSETLGLFATWLGAILLILPGPLTDFIGLVLIIPWLRRFTFGLWITRNLHRVVMQRSQSSRTYEGEIVETRDPDGTVRHIIDVSRQDANDK